MRRINDLNSLMGELSALQESAEGKLKGGFASFNVSMFSSSDGSNTECLSNGNCSGNGTCKNNTNCFDNTKCEGNTNGTCTPPPTTTADSKPSPDKGKGGNAIFSSLMF